MIFNQALVVYKQVPRITRGHTNGQKLHLKTLSILYPLLRQLGVSFETCPTGQLSMVKTFDLVITVGGDGTVLSTSHFVEAQPILGIKSYGRESIGYFCAATIDTMQRYLESILEGQIKPKKLNRLEVTLNNRKIKELALNDVLFAHASPAATAKYALTISKKKETQRSSGIWISSAAGSTAAISAAGGLSLPLGSKKLEYFVREPYAPLANYKLIKGVLPPTRPLKIYSMTKHGVVFIDGSHIQYPAPEGTKITVKGSGRPLNIFWKM